VVAAKGVRGKGRQPLSPPRAAETRSAISAPKRNLTGLINTSRLPLTSAVERQLSHPGVPISSAIIGYRFDGCGGRHPFL
jgi:hypothetical protein